MCPGEIKRSTKWSARGESSRRAKYSRVEVALAISISPRRRPWKIMAPDLQRRGREAGPLVERSLLKRKRSGRDLTRHGALRCSPSPPPPLSLSLFSFVLVILFHFFLSFSLSRAHSETLIGYIRSDLLPRLLGRWGGHLVVSFVNPLRFERIPKNE